MKTSFKRLTALLLALVLTLSLLSAAAIAAQSAQTITHAILRYRLRSCASSGFSLESSGLSRSTQTAATAVGTAAAPVSAETYDVR